MIEEFLLIIHENGNQYFSRALHFIAVVDTYLHVHDTIVSFRTCARTVSEKPYQTEMKKSRYLDEY